MIINKVNRFDIKGKNVLSSLSKYYATDFSMIEINEADINLNLGARLENLVYNQLLAFDYEVYVGKTYNGEIDFVVKKGRKKKYIQVSYILDNEKTILREFNAFLINNRDKLVELFSEISQDQIGEIKETDILKSEWFIPSEQYYKEHRRIKKNKDMLKNAFTEYGNNILIAPNRTYTEVSFENWCETSSDVKWIYKNGDKGDLYFSIVYRIAFRRNNFYTDYIVQLQNGDVWIIEAKGGLNADGNSNNIDKYAKNKFEALKEYGERHPNVKWGFIRAVGSQIYLSNTIWDEDVTNNNVWEPIENFIK